MPGKFYQAFSVLIVYQVTERAIFTMKIVNQTFDFHGNFF